MSEKPVVTITVDTNNIVRGGLTLAYVGRLDSEISVGDAVIAHDIAEESDFSAEVMAVKGSKAYLRLDWESAKPW